MNTLTRAIQAVGGTQSALAGLLDVTQPTISEWLRGERPIPADRCTEIEQATHGAVTCEELRSDVQWARIPDKSWPWHKKGRPVIDVTKAAA